MALIVIAVVLALLYNVFIIYKYKTIPESLSEISYIASPTLFSSFIGTETILFLVPWLNKSSIGIIPYIAAISLIVCASAPLFKEKFHKAVHYVSAGIAMLCIVLWIIVSGHYNWLCTALLPLVGVGWKSNSWVYWFELWAILLLSILLL